MRFNTIIKEIAKENIKIKDIIDGKYQHISYSLFYSNKFKNSDNKEDIKNITMIKKPKKQQLEFPNLYTKIIKNYYLL